MPDMPWKGLARMYPNPTTSVVRIEVPEAGFTVRVTNLIGQLISEVSAQEAELVLDLSHVAAGMYQVELFREGQVMSIDKLHVLH
jgi:predicted ATPase